MKSMVNTTGLDAGAGVVVLCSIPVTLSTPAGHKVATKTLTTAQTPPAPSPTPPQRRFSRRRYRPTQAVGRPDVHMR